MARGRQTESFQNIAGGKGVYDVLTFQRSREGKSSPGGGGKGPPKCSPDEYLCFIARTHNYSIHRL